MSEIKKLYTIEYFDDIKNEWIIEPAYKPFINIENASAARKECIECWKMYKWRISTWVRK